MRFLPICPSATPLSYGSWSSSLLCRKTAVANYLTRRSRTTQAKRHADLDAVTGRDLDTFQASGVRPAIVASLHDAFPHVQQPTAMQKKLIHAVMDNKDLMLQDITGSGKSFAVLLALLSKPRAVTYDLGQKDKTSAKDAITTLLLVPHRDLAYQYLHWIYHIITAKGDTRPYALSSTVQVLVRHSNSKNLEPMLEAMVDPREDLSMLREHPPHILIATPNAAFDVIHRVPEILQLSTLSTVVVDEADALINSVSQNDKKRDKKKSAGKLHKHEQVLPQFLDLLFDVVQGRDIARPIEVRKSLLQRGLVPVSRPQLIMLSATMRNRLRTALFGAYGWYRRGKAVKLIKNGPSSRPTHKLNQSAIHHASQLIIQIVEREV
ncbi:P-loop containing nucleoside triphosphate hydrolase protein [Phlebopus sp. FC_14]|nr:P-loop containing nucleoside triphosphate hydrolase protein [Phlebopus sp. FC_14]